MQAPTRYKFTVDEYYRMAEAGILTEDSRVELIEGEIIAMTPIGFRHAFCVTEQQRIFQAGLGARAVVRVQQPIRLGADDEPQPDVVLARPRDDGYLSGHPGPADILLVIEVADSSLAFDRDGKIPLYGRSGIPEAWLWNLVADRLEAYRDPTAAGYRSVTFYQRGESAAPLAFPDLQLRTDEVLRRQEGA